MRDELRHHEHAQAFIEATRSLWEPREVELNLLVGIACTISSGAFIAEHGAFFATLEREARPVAAVLRTPPHGFVVAAEGPGDGAALARAVGDAGEHLDASAVIATRPHAEEFARAWRDATGRAPSLDTAQRIMAVSTVIPPPAPVGRFRRATAGDAGIVAPWFHDFALEAVPHEAGDRDTTIAASRGRIERGSVYVWEVDGEPVSMATQARPTPYTTTVTAVYTPPPWRGRGYAAACVAGASQAVLDSGKRCACLYTDATNSTSNALYERIGYRWVCDSQLWRFA